MKKKFFISIFILILSLILIAIFHNYIINFSLPLIKDRIQNQLNITGDENTKLNIKTNFSNKTITLSVKNPILKKNEYIKSGRANSIIVEKKFKNLLNKKISKLIINNLNLETNNSLANSNEKENYNINKVLKKIIIEIKKIEEFSIFQSNINLSASIDNHKIYLDELNINNNISLIKSKGIILSGFSKNKFQINSLKDNDFIDLKIDLNSYSFNHLKNIFDIPNSGLLFDNFFDGDINFTIEPNFENYKIVYDIISTNNKVLAYGNYDSNNNVHESEIRIYNTKFENYLPKNSISKLFNISKLGETNIKLKVSKDFNNINFFITGNDIEFTAEGEIKSNLISNINIKVNDINPQDYLIDKNLLKLGNYSTLDNLNIEINSKENFNIINFNIYKSDNTFIANGEWRDNNIYEFNAKGKSFGLSNIIENTNLNLKIIPDWFYEGLINNNSFSFEINYLFPNEYLNINVIDSFENIISSKFNMNSNIVEELEIIFFNNESNKFIWDKNNLTLNATFDQELKNFFANNFNKNIFDDLDIYYVKDFKKVYFEAKIADDYLDKLNNVSNLNNFINNFSLSVIDASIDLENLNLAKNIVNIDGLIDITYEQNNIEASKEFIIDLNNTNINIDKINYYKKVNESLTASFNYENYQNNKILLNNFILNGDEINIEGNITILDNIINQINFSSFKLLDNDFKLKLKTEEDIKSANNNSFNVEITGKKLDLSFLNIKETKSFFKNIPISINISVKRLKYINETDFIPAEVTGYFFNVWQNLYFKGLFDTGEDLNILIKPVSDGRYFDILSSNSGKALGIKKISKSVRGGLLKFKGKYNSFENNDFFNAELSLTNFAIKKKSKLAKFIKVIRVFDIKKQLAGDTEDFEYAEMKIKKRNKIFKIENGKAYGGLMALTAEGIIDKNTDIVEIKGMVAPTHAIDSWVSKIPLFGTILTGIEGGGVVAANYSVKGTIKDPKYFVNPLSILTPGIFKEFWKIFELQKPKAVN